MIAVFDGVTGARQATIPMPPMTPAVRLAYLPDGSGLVVTSLDGRIWTVETRRYSWVQRACAIAGRNLTPAEWSEYFPNRAYTITCTQWPEGNWFSAG